eukprot:CAMPEP_0204916456 /NCGR_PEP_ID=MMETSP1397-20131031/14254_1 /ASSEMBLY_ACC=CAM_ASM_000891 /TAXON_ID=49980 /ORGANISM="Climacostomum Climacostomum virens, Strain Stock W-24" /LENGTH=533 /DNA_ID=CAMNT_0052088953 /DNA_START=20 /DNA_END=1618 /DNA_ORIENTATION=+
MEDSETKPLLNFIHDKAGMKGVDKEKVAKVVEELTKGSEFSRKQEEREKQIEEKVKQYREQLEAFYAKGVLYRNKAEALVERRTQEIMMEICLEETWVHVDMDMFYVAVELRDNPELADKPVAVGGNNMISTSNYIARKFGVRSAMPGFIAKKLCPELVLIPHNIEKYKAVGEVVRGVFREYDPHFEAMGLDEGHLCITGYLRDRELDTPEGRQSVIEELRQKVHDLTSLTCSAGIACNKMLAKIASDLNKPNGQYYLPFDVEAITTFIRGLSVRKIPGIGKVLEKVLNGLGIHTCQEIIEHKLELSVLMSENSFSFLLRSAMGIGCTQHSKAEDQKSISISRTFSPTEDTGFLTKKLKEFAESSTIDAKSQSMAAMCVTVHIRTLKYQERSKSETSKTPLREAEEVFHIAMKLMRELFIKEPVRLIGLRLSRLCNDVTRTKPITSFISPRASIGGPSDAPPRPVVIQQPGLELKEFTCPACLAKIEITEGLMKLHVQSCSAPPLKRKRSSPRTLPKRAKVKKGYKRLEDYYN